jgi:hypothetical protein
MPNQENTITYTLVSSYIKVFYNLVNNLKTLILLKYIYLISTKFTTHYIYLLSFAKIDILLCNLVRNRQKRREESSFSIAKSIFEDKKT